MVAIRSPRKISTLSGCPSPPLPSTRVAPTKAIGGLAGSAAARPASAKAPSKNSRPTEPSMLPSGFWFQGQV
jgi:hypothetical protein